MIEVHVKVNVKAREGQASSRPALGKARKANKRKFQARLRAGIRSNQKWRSGRNYTRKDLQDRQG